MQKPHITPLATNFFNAAQKGIEYVQERRYLHFEGNIATISLIFNSSTMLVQGSISNLLQKFRAILRKYCNKHLHKLHLNFNNCIQIDQLELHNLGLDIAANFRNLQVLTIQFYSCQDMTDEKIRCFIMPISKVLSNLSKLSITISQCEKITDKGINHIRSLLFIHFKRLLSLKISCSPQIVSLNNGKRVPVESNITKRNHNDINFFERPLLMNSKITQETIANIAKTISTRFRNLQSLYLVPPFTTQIGEYNSLYHDRILSIIQSLRLLKNFCLGFQPFCLASVQDFVKISEIIGKNLLKLQYLTIYFEGYSTDEKFSGYDLAQSSSNIFSNLPLLRSLAVSFGKVHILQQVILAFVKKICEHAKNLKEMVFEVKCGSFISRQGIEILIQHLNENLPSLKKFMLNTRNFDIPLSNDNEAEPEIHSFSQQGCPNLKEFHLLLHNSDYIPLLTSKNVEKLTLSFKDCKRMFNKHFKRLIKTIFQRPLHHLQDLTIICKNASRLTDEAFKALLCEDWIPLVSLRCFKLEISQAPSLTDSTLKHMEALVAENLKHIKALKTVSFAFISCRGLTRSAIQSFIMSIARNLKNLQELELDFHQGPAIEGFSDIGISIIIDSIVLSMKALKKVVLNFSFIIDESRPFRFPPGFDPYKNMREYWKKLKHVPVVEINFGPKYNYQ